MAKTNENTVNTNEVTVVEKELKTKPSPLNVPEVQEIDGYVTTEKAAKLLSEKLNEEIKTSYINYRAYTLQVKAVRIGGTMLIHKESLLSASEGIVNEKKKAEKKAALMKRLQEVKADEDLTVREQNRLLKELKEELEKL